MIRRDFIAASLSALAGLPLVGRMFGKKAETVRIILGCDVAHGSDGYSVITTWTRNSDGTYTIVSEELFPPHKVYMSTVCDPSDWMYSKDA